MTLISSTRADLSAAAVANLMVRGPADMLAPQYQSVLEAARHESELAEQALAEGSADFRVERTRAQIGVDEVMTALPADAALVSFVRYQRSAFGSTPTSSRTVLSCTWRWCYGVTSLPRSCP